MSNCDHEWVNVGFNRVCMACKVCGVKQETYENTLRTSLYDLLTKDKGPIDGTGISEDFDGDEEESDFG